MSGGRSEVGEPVSVVPYRGAWPEAFEVLAARLAEVTAPWSTRIDHIGSTAVPGLAAKDVIDIQVSVRHHDDLDPAFDALVANGWAGWPYQRDHVVPGGSQDPGEWTKRLVAARLDERRTNVHLRVEGRANQRYALLFRDYLRAMPDTAEAYARFKLLAAELVPGGIETYADLKDPVCDLIFLPAEAWAELTAWTP